MKLLKSKKFIIGFIIALGLFVSGKIFLDNIYVPAIIMYHSVGSEESALDGYGSKLNVSPEAFEKQMRFLARGGYNVIPLQEFIMMIKNGKRVPHKTVAITFDDGLKNNFENAYPALVKYGLPATMFVATDFIGKNNFMSRDDLIKMKDSPVSIGSHTKSHTWLPSLTDDEVREELSGSKRILEQITGKKVTTLSYPIGAHDERVKKIAEETGYIGAVATNPGKKRSWKDPYALKRVRISMTSDNLIVFWIYTSGYYTFIKEVRDDD